MRRPVGKTLKNWEVAIRLSWGNDISTPWRHLLALVHFHIIDQAFLRTVWTNAEALDDGFSRSNQPGPGRLRRLARSGVKTVINLRGARPESHYLIEREACERLGLKLIDIPLLARGPNSRSDLLALVDAFKTAERPVVMHCKSGADRAGLASTLYMMLMKDRPLNEALDQLSLRFLHLKSTRTGICDHFFELYRQDTAHNPMPIDRWIDERYDPRALKRSFNALRGQAT